MSIQGLIAGKVMSEIVREQDEDALAVDLSTLWHVVEVTVQVAVPVLAGNMNADPAVLHQSIARATPVVMKEIKMGRKIQAIKELRDAAKISLKEAKEAVEVVWEEEGISSAGAPL
jgi:ribosomal protein L7/L12